MKRAIFAVVGLAAIAASLMAVAAVQANPTVDIDIKPGSDPNSINPRSRGLISVAILGSDTFDVTDVDVTTLAFGPDGASPVHIALEDVNEDGYVDLISHYRTQDAGFKCGDTEGILRGRTVDGVAIEGSDSVRIVPCR